MSGTTVVPISLSLGAEFVLTKPADRIESALRYTLYAVKNSTSLYYQETVSIVDLVTAYSNDPTTLCTQIQTQLQSMLTRMFPSANQVSVTATSSAQATTSAYSLSLSIQVIIGSIAYSVSPNLRVVDGNLVTRNDNIDLAVNTVNIGD